MFQDWAIYILGTGVGALVGGALLYLLRAVGVKIPFDFSRDVETLGGIGLILILLFITLKYGNA